MGLPLPDIVSCIKAMSTKKYSAGVKQSGWQPFNGKLRQRNYYEHIIRDENELLQIREYVENNPADLGNRAGMIKIWVSGIFCMTFP
jgi:putative transposase